MTIFTINLFWITISPSYYWLMYAFGFLAWYYYLLKTKILTKPQVEDLFFYMVLWVILGWRIWYILFYDLSYYISNPLDVFKVWKWWMSFHGWALWVIISGIIFSKINKISFLKLIDEIAVIVTVWLWLWRIWNYLNKELLGFEYNWFLAVEKNWISYFPSPLVESFLEWLVMFFILKYINKNKDFDGKTWCYFLIFYWIFRTFIELFLRTPDVQIWYIFGFFTMWSLLSLPMILIWIILLFIIKKWKFHSQIH